MIARGQTAREFEIGDRVFGIVGGGGLAERVVVHERHVVAVPAALDDAGAAAVPEVFITAHDAVCTLAGLRPGELLVVTGANGGVGTAAVQIGAVAGARVLATVRAVDVRRDVAALGAEVIGQSDLAERAQRARRRGRRRRARRRAEPRVAILRALAMKGRIVIVGTGAGADAELSLRALMGRRARLIGTMLRARPLEEKALAVQAFGREVVPHLAARRIVPLVDRVFPAGEARAAFDRMEEPGKLGKVLLDFGS